MEVSTRTRVSFQGHDFFTPQPVEGADAYLLRMIIHDWPRKEAKVILQHLARAMRHGSHLVIMDTLLPPPGSVPVTQEAALRVRDLTMRQTFNSSERELEEWSELFASCKPPLHLKDCAQPAGSAMAVMDVMLVGDGDVVG